MEPIRRQARGALTAVLLLLAAGGQRPAAAQSAGESPAHTTLVYPPFAHTLGIHRAEPVHLKFFLGDRTRFDDPQGVAAVKFSSDDDPEIKGDDFQLTLFGVNAGRGEIIYNSSMKTLALYGGKGSGDGRFVAPRGIAATPDGRIYVADGGNRRVARLRWDPIGRRLQWAGAWPAPQPFDVATDSRGQVWVADPEANAVLRFADSTAGAGTSFLAASPIEGDRWPLPGDVDRPTALAIGDSLDPWYQPADYRLYLVDSEGGRLRAYAADSVVVAEISPAELERPEGEAGRFGYVALDYYGNVYVTDPLADMLYKLDHDLRPLATFPGPGPATDRLDEPRGIAIWRRFGQVFVAEREGARYFFVGTDFETAEDPLEVRLTGELAGYEFGLFLTEASLVSAAFLDAAGDTLAFVEAGTFGPGPVVVTWGESAWASPPAPGWRERAEMLSIEARPTYSSRKRFSRIRTLGLDWSPTGTP